MAIPNGYRLLTANDVGKTFGVDLESIVYFDTSVTPNAVFNEYSATNLTNFMKSTYSFFDPPDSNCNAIYFGTSILTFIYLDNVYSSSDTPWEMDSYTFTESLEITSYYTDTNWNNFFYVKDIEVTNPYTIKIKNKNGIILKTANKLCTENITLVLDESLFEPTGPVLTLICDSDVLNSSNYQYSIDSGTTWNQFTSETMILKNVETIKFSSPEGEGFGNYGYHLYIGTTSGAADIDDNQGVSEDFTLSEDTTWYLTFYYNNGGAS